MNIKQNAQIKYFQNIEAQSSMSFWTTTVKFRGIQVKNPVQSHTTTNSVQLRSLQSVQFKALQPSFLSVSMILFYQLRRSCKWSLYKGFNHKKTAIISCYSLRRYTCSRSLFLNWTSAYSEQRIVSSITFLRWLRNANKYFTFLQGVYVSVHDFVWRNATEFFVTKLIISTQYSQFRKNWIHSELSFVTQAYILSSLKA
jgi:hypothetical protein